VTYDLIGDLHGHCEPLIELLDKPGYREVGGVFQRPDRRVMFLGDFIDRGPAQREVIDVVRPMIDTGAALSVMGNHEFNAIANATPDPADPAQYLRRHTDKNRRQHQVFLNAYAGEEDYAELIAWFRSLPLWLDLDGLRVVHACWDAEMMQRLADRYPSLNETRDDELLAAASRKDSPEYEAVETRLKGKEIPLPPGRRFFDKDGNPRHEIRIRWWDADAENYRAAVLGPDTALSHTPEDPIDVDYLIEYAADAPPVFIGHYWMDSEPDLLAHNVARLDFIVAAPAGGRLVAYRWDGEQRLSADRFVVVRRQP